MKKWIAIWILILTEGLFLRAQDPYLEGIARLEEGNTRQARELFIHALENGANPANTYLMIAETHFRDGAYGEAIKWADRSNELDSERGHYLLARSFAMSGKAPEAIQYLEKHMRSGDRLPRHQILLDTAFSGIEKSVSWKAFWKNDWYSEKEQLQFEAAYLRKSGDYLQALDLIAEGLAQDPRWDKLYAEKGFVLSGMGNHPGALRAFTRAIEISPQNPDYFLGRAGSLVELERYREGIRDLEYVLRQKPEMLQLIKEISILCKKEGNFRDAEAYIQQYLQYFPMSAEGYFIHAEILHESGRLLKALVSYNRCLELDASKAKYFLGRGKAYLDTDTWSYALKDFSMALDLDPYNPETWYLKGMCRMKLNDAEGARKDFEIAARYGSPKASRQLKILQ